MSELGDYIRLVSKPAQEALRARNRVLQDELWAVLEYALIEDAPLREQEINSIKRVLGILPPAEGGDGSGAHDASAKGQHGLTPNPPPIKPEGKEVGS